MGKTGARQDRSAVLQWVVVLGVGALIVTVVLGLNLISRLNDGQKVLNGAKPAFRTQSLKAAVAGIDFISTDVDMANPIAGPSGGGAAQIPKLVAFVSKKTGLTDAQVLAALAKNFPAATHLLEALPLSNVSAEVPKLVAFLSANLHLTDAQVLAAVHKNFPALYAAITNVGTVTGGWNSISGTQSFTDFNGKPVRTVPQLRDFFKGQLIPAVAAQQSNFQSLDGTSITDLDRAAAADHRDRGDRLRGDHDRGQPPRRCAARGGGRGSERRAGRRRRRGGAGPRAGFDPAHR